MAATFTNVREFRRGKGNRQTRLGPRGNMDTLTRRGGDKNTQTPDDIAIKKLVKLLDKPGLSLKDRYAYAGLMKQAEQIRFMNMSVLAEVLLYMHDIGNDVTGENFNYVSISPYVNRLLPRREVIEGGIKTKQISDEDIEIMRLRMSATFLRYIRYVLFLRAQVATNFEQANLDQRELQPFTPDGL